VGLVEPRAAAREWGWGGQGQTVASARGGGFFGGRFQHPQKWHWGDRRGRGAGLRLGGRLHWGSEEYVVVAGQGRGGEGLIGRQQS